jgi:hypothetical protein
MGASQLFQRHIDRRPYDRAWLRQASVGRFLQPRQSEVDQHRFAVAVDHHVGRL